MAKTSKIEQEPARHQKEKKMQAEKHSKKTLESSRQAPKKHGCG